MGTGGVSLRAALNRGVSPYALTLLRTLFAVVAVVAVLAARRRRPNLDRVAWRVGAVLGVANLGIPFILWTLALERASAGFVGLLTAAAPITTALWAHVLLPAERLRVAMLAGLVVALGGVVTLLGTGDAGLAAGGQPVLAGVLALTGMIMAAFCGAYAKRDAGRYDPLEVCGIQFAVASVVIAAAMLVVEGLPEGMSPAAWGIVAYSGVITAALPWVVILWLLRHISATYAAVTGYIGPLVAVLAGALVLGEHLGLGIAVGGTLILAGVLLTDRAERRSTLHRTGPTH
jgi:drug/metabolite transporter (DMT)-like permease